MTEQVTMTVEINPLVDGYLKQGLLSLELEDTKDLIIPNGLNPSNL